MIIGIFFDWPKSRSSQLSLCNTKLEKRACFTDCKFWLLIYHNTYYNTKIDKQSVKKIWFPLLVLLQMGVNDNERFSCSNSISNIAFCIQKSLHFFFNLFFDNIFWQSHVKLLESTDNNVGTIQRFRLPANKKRLQRNWNLLNLKMFHTNKKWASSTTNVNASAPLAVAFGNDMFTREISAYLKWNRNLKV